MNELRRIDVTPYKGRFKVPAGSDPGPKPELRWIKIALLRVDPSYQRFILRAGEKNVISIAENFDWSMFSTIIVASIAGGLFAVIDGQHHVTSAALRGFAEVPCAVVTADRFKQARAFAAVNGNVTAMTPLQLHAARLASGDAKATALAQACAEADVTICRYPVPGNKMKPGETLAAGTLLALLAKYGRDVFVAALCCITQTRRGNPGMIRGQIVDALCAVLEAEPSWWADRKRLIRAMQSFDFAAGFNIARAAAIAEGATVSEVLVDRISAHLEAKLPVKA